MSNKKRNLLFQIFIFACSFMSIISQVFELTEVSFDLYTRDKDVMLVEFIMPWCRHCQALQPEWEKATQILAENREYVMGKVNCWESGKSLCDKLKIAMYPEIRLYRHGVYTETYEGERTAAALLDFVQRAQATAGHVGPPATSSILQVPVATPPAPQQVAIQPPVLKPTMPPLQYPQYNPTPQPYPPAYPPEIPSVSYSSQPNQPPIQQQLYPPKVQPPPYFPPPPPPRLPPPMRQVPQPYKPLAPPYLPPTPPKMVVTSEQFYTTPLSGAYQAPPGAINLPIQTISAKPDQEFNFYETIVPPPPNSGSNFQVQEMPMGNFQPPNIASASVAAQRLGQTTLGNGQFIPGRETPAFEAPLQTPSLPNIESLYGPQREVQGVPADVYSQNGYETQQQYTANIPNAANQMSFTTPIKPNYIPPQTYRYTHNMKASQLQQPKPMYYSYQGAAKNEQHVKDNAGPSLHGPSLANYLATLQSPPASIPPAAQQYQQKYQTQSQQYNKQQQQQYKNPQTGAGNPHGSGPSDLPYNHKTLSNPFALFAPEAQAQEKMFQDTSGVIHYSKKEDMPQVNNLKVSYDKRLNQYLNSDKTKETNYPNPAPLVYHFGNSTWPHEKVKLKLSFEPSANGKYEMKVNGPFDVYGKKIPKVARNEVKMKNVDYDHLSDEDKLRLSQQINREEIMEDARESYDSKYLPPTNRGYKSPPSFLKSDETDGIRRPLVRVNIPRYANKSVVLTNILPGSKKSLSIKLPVNVSLETVLKNIYNHMYEYYFHKTPSESNTKEEATARKVIQELINKDMKNISNYISTQTKGLINNKVSSKSFETSTVQGDLPAYVRPNTIVEPIEENNLRIEPIQTIFSYNNASIIQPNSENAEIEKKMEQVKVEGSESTSATQSDQSILSSNDHDNYRDSEQGITRSNFPPYQENQRYTLKLRGSLESNIKTLEFIHKNNLINNDNKDLVNSLLSLPLSAIAEEHYKKSTVGRQNMPFAFSPQTSSIKHQITSQLINNSTVDKLQTINGLDKNSVKFEKPYKAIPLLKPHKPLKSLKDYIMPISNEANYFLIDTTGVSKNKPMIIETVAEYLKKKNSHPQKSQNQYNVKDSHVFNRMISKKPLETYKFNSRAKPAFKTEYNNDKDHYFKPVQNLQQVSFLNKQQDVQRPLFNSHEIKADSRSSNLFLNSKSKFKIQNPKSYDNIISKSIQPMIGSTSAYVGKQNDGSYSINLQKVKTEFSDTSYRSGVNSVEPNMNKAISYKNEGDDVIIGEPRIIGESPDIKEQHNMEILNKDETQRPFKNADEFFGSSIIEKNTLEDNQRPFNSKTSKSNHLYSDSARYKGSVYTLDEELKETERKNGKSSDASESNDEQWDKKVFVPGSSNMIVSRNLQGSSNVIDSSNALGFSDVQDFRDLAGNLPREDNVISKKSSIPSSPLFTNDEILDQRNRIMRHKLVLMKRDKVLNKRMNKEDEYSMKNVTNTNKMPENNALDNLSQVGEKALNDNYQDNKTLSKDFNATQRILQKRDIIQKKKSLREIKTTKKNTIRHTSTIKKKKKKTFIALNNETIFKKEDSEFANFTFNPKKNVSQNLFDDSDMGQLLPMENEDYGLSASLEPEKKIIIKTSDITERVK
ncbi:uncharacterized protein LOC124815218 isoform X2 [Hydra vulgaris]|uniref:uncharacterized protein LOC124815218 isoform X2 n=1 Tax=Hydra vulgaris TaxID=6087 RepID=UPI001F5EC143|nr:uncharacterized protein LOC124815218 isoform X2 [Hydra vulgaris]